MKAMAMVAHPDDCVIFAYSFIHHYPMFDWTVCYLTYTEQDPRGREFADFWLRRNTKTKFLGFTDDWEFVKNGKLGFESAQAVDAIKEAIADQDLILTHDHLGDYGHLHHKFIHDVVCNNHTYMVCFAGIGKGNVKYTIESDTYSLDEFPLHRDIVASFHQTQHANEYTVSERVKNIL
jgi:hypothetical protein